VFTSAEMPRVEHACAEGDLMELNGWSSPQMPRRYGAIARSARARRTYDRIMQVAVTRAITG
jgi:hypothetical protein